MTREEMAGLVEELPLFLHSSETPTVHEQLRTVAAELRKTCATCWHFQSKPDSGVKPWCPRVHFIHADGSGFCHQWEAKP